MFDSHCHPTDIEDPCEVVLAACRAGVNGLLACGYNHESNRAVLELRQRFPHLPFAIGIHPWFAEEPLDDLPSLLEREAPTVVGECGLDFANDETLPSRELQYRAFEMQLGLAQLSRKAVTVHSRRAVAEVLETLAPYARVIGVMHAFGGSLEQAKAFVDRGWLIGIGGAVTRTNARRVHRLAAGLPLEAIALETDAPAIGLQGVNPPDVRPAHLPQVARAVAALRGIELDSVVKLTDANVSRVFGINASSTCT